MLNPIDWGAVAFIFCVLAYLKFAVFFHKFWQPDKESKTKKAIDKETI